MARRVDVSSAAAVERDELSAEEWVLGQRNSGRRAASLTTLRVSQDELQRLILRSARRVANLPPDTASVVWTLGASELHVHTAKVTAECGDGIVTVVVPVGCDQIRGTSDIRVVFAVGSARRPAGLVMGTTTRPSGPEVVVSVWSDALVAFAYETLIHLCAGLTAATGQDRSGRAFIPSAVASVPGALVVSRMARHSIRWSR